MGANTSLAVCALAVSALAVAFSSLAVFHLATDPLILELAVDVCPVASSTSSTRAGRAQRFS